MELPKTINLLPPPTKEEVKVEETKGKISVGSVFLLFLFVSVGVVILGFNYYYKKKLQKIKQQESSLTSSIESMYGVENKQRILISKWLTVKAVYDYTVREYDTEANIVLDLDKSYQTCDINSFAINNDFTFTISGMCNEYIDALKISDELANNKLIQYAYARSLTNLEESSSSSNDFGDRKWAFSIAGKFTYEVNGS